jgi:multidrug efflux pump subunit AcrB
LTTTVDNIEHIESTTVAGQAVVKVFLQPNASIDTANAQITAISQAILRQSFNWRFLEKGSPNSN